LIREVEDDPLIQTQIVYAKPPADGALPDSAGTSNVVHTPTGCGDIGSGSLPPTY
jgi:hypothetical protein